MKSQHDTRTILVVIFTVAVWLGLAMLRTLTSFGVISARPLQDWSLVDRVSVVLGCAALAAVGVLASAFLATKHFALFSRIDKLLTRLPMGFLGGLLIAFASYTVITKVYEYHRSLLGWSEAVSMLVGSFLCFWVFLFYGRNSSEPMPV